MVDDAVQIALLKKRGLQTSYAELGIAEADLVQAGRLRNPRFAYLSVRAGGNNTQRKVQSQGPLGRQTRRQTFDQRAETSSQRTDARCSVCMKFPSPCRE